MLTQEQSEVLMGTYKNGDELRAALANAFMSDQLVEAVAPPSEDWKRLVRNADLHDAEARIRAMEARTTRSLGFWQFLEDGQLVCGGRVRFGDVLYERKRGGIYVDGRLIQGDEDVAAGPRLVETAA